MTKSTVLFNDVLSIEHHLNCLLNTRLKMSYEHYGLHSIEDYKRSTTQEDELQKDIFVCISHFEKRLCDVRLKMIPTSKEDVFRCYQLQAMSQNGAFQKDLIVLISGKIKLVSSEGLHGWK